MRMDAGRDPECRRGNGHLLWTVSIVLCFVEPTGAVSKKVVVSDWKTINIALLSTIFFVCECCVRRCNLNNIMPHQSVDPFRYLRG